MPTAGATKRAFAWLDSDDDDDDDGGDAMYANVPQRHVSFYIAPGRVGSFSYASPRVQRPISAHDMTDECKGAGEGDGNDRGGDEGGHGGGERGRGGGESGHEGDRDDTSGENGVLLALPPVPVTPTKTQPASRAPRPAIVTPPKSQPVAKLTAARRLRRAFAKL